MRNWRRDREPLCLLPHLTWCRGFWEAFGDDCKIKPHVHIPSGVIIEDEVFLGLNVTFTNDKHPRVKGDWKLLKTIVRQRASIGAHSVIPPEVEIGKKAVVGAGSVVTTNVPDGTTVCGNPARPSEPMTIQLAGSRLVQSAQDRRDSTRLW